MTVPLLVMAAIAAPALSAAAGNRRFDLHAHHEAPLLRSEAESPLAIVQAQRAVTPPRPLFHTRVSGGDVPYWRLASLDSYDGTTWTGAAAYRPAGTVLPGPRAPSATREVRAEIRVDHLDGPWVPTTGIPRGVTAGGLRYDARTSTLVAPHGASTLGAVYAIDAVVPVANEATITPGGFVAGSERERETALPPGIPPIVTELAQRVTRDADSPGEKVAALVSYLRSTYTFDSDAAPGQSLAHVAFFLGDSKRQGGAAQFVSAFVVMARSLGIPARVAAGYRPGIAAGDGGLDVTTAQAQAWAEVETEGSGWVAVDPVPDKVGAEQQGVAGGSVAPKPVPARPPPAPKPKPPRPPRRKPVVPSSPGDALATVAALSIAGFAVLAMLFAVCAAGIVLAKARRLARLRRASPRVAVAGAWSALRGIVEAAGSGGTRTLGVAGTTSLAERLPGAGTTNVVTLGEIVDCAFYDVEEPAPSDASAVWERVDRLRAGYLGSVGLGRRIRFGLDPRPLRRS